MAIQNQLPDPDVWLGQKKAQSLPDPETWLRQKQAPALPDPDAWMQQKAGSQAQPAARAIPTLTVGGGPFVRQARRTPGIDVAVRQLEKLPTTPLVPLSRITEPYMAPEPGNRPPIPVMSTGGFTARPIRRTAGPEAQQPAVLHGALKALEGMTTPQNIALMAALGPLTSADLEFLGFLNSTLLAGDAVRQGILGWQEAKKAEMAGDEAGAAAGKTQAVFDGLMAAGFLRHGTRSLRERGQSYSGMVDRLQAGIQSPHLDGPSLEGIRRFIDQPGALEPKDRADLLNMADERAATLPGVRPVVANVPTARPQAEAPMPGTLAAGPFPGPQQSIRAQMNAPQQTMIGAPPTGTATPTQPPIQQQPTRAVTPPRQPGATLPGVQMPRAVIDPNQPMMDLQRRALFAVANSKGVPAEGMEALAGKRISQLTVGEARVLIDKVGKLTPEDVRTLKPPAATPLLEATAVERAGNAPGPAPAQEAAPAQQLPVETITVGGPRRASTFDPSKSLVNAIKSLGGIDPEKIRKAGLWTDWTERVPQGIRLAVQKNGATHGLDTLGGELGNLGYQNFDLPDSLIEALADPRKARAGLREVEQASELEQAKAHIQDLERRLGETEFNPTEFKMAGEEKPPIREPREEGFARIFDFQKRKPGVKEDANELRTQLYETQDYADRWITRLKAKYGYPEDIWEHATKADSDHFDYLDSAMENLKGRIAVAEGKTEPGEVVTGPWKGEEGFARYRDEKTKELFGEEPFALRGGTAAREEPPRVAPKTGELRPAPQQTNLLQGPLFERPGEARSIPEPQPTEAGPFTAQDVERFNRLSHFPKDLAKENASFNAETAQWRQEAIDRLKRYGIDEIPEDVENALSRLRAARLNMAREFTRAREVAPPWTVTGRSNYRGNPERAHAIEGKAVNEYEAAKEYLNRALQRHSPNAPISADKENAPDLLQAKIDKAEKQQEAMRLANAIVRKKGLTDEQKIEQIANLLDISKETAAKVLEPDYMGRVGFADYQLQNNLANIKRMKARVSGIEETRAKPTAETPFDGGRIVDNAEDNRIQLIFDGKPDPQTIIKLKSLGFRWAPSQGAWQRQRTENARYAVVQVLGDKFPAGERGRFIGTQARGPVEELPPTGPVEEKPARTQVSVEEEIKGLQGDIATGEMRLRSKVNAIG
ncbi:MAG: hypothetical protein LAP85_29330, partial [Acidobacteriia bacterium]|nr:hypothetical protein [Terriglobia bacterium]